MNWLRTSLNTYKSDERCQDGEAVPTIVLIFESSPPFLKKERLLPRVSTATGGPMPGLASA